jgi:hypothetical protein
LKSINLYRFKSLIKGLIGFKSFVGFNVNSPKGNSDRKSLKQQLKMRNLEKEKFFSDILMNTPSDKVSHGYIAMYASIFDSFDSFDLIVEFGIGSTDPKTQTNSLTAWSELSNNSKVIGFDIDHNCFFTNSKIESFWVDQVNWKSMENDALLKIKSFKPTSILIIDDGLHEPIAFINVIKIFNSLNNYRCTLVIEDLRLSYALVLFIWNKFFGFKNNAVSLAHRNGKQKIISNIFDLLIHGWNWNNVYVVTNQY